MVNKSSVSGVSGAVRIQRLSGVSLAAAEAHGKRLDAIGKARSIIDDAPPITTTGLDLDTLYEAQVKGAKVQKSHTKALHLLLQFPKDLVNGEDAEAMLTHARKFAVSIFGEEAIFADRVDRDEKSRHVVDLFIAPKYQKVTKRQTQTAISTSKHLKELAAQRGKAPNLRGQGQALQDAWFDYLKTEMRLNVKRGDPKKLAGSDWESAEELEAERIRKAAEHEAEMIRQGAAIEAGNILTEAKVQAHHIVRAADEEARKHHAKRDIAKRQADESSRRAAELDERLKALRADLWQEEDRMASLKAELAILEQEKASTQVMLADAEQVSTALRAVESTLRAANLLAWPEPIEPPPENWRDEQDSYRRGFHQYNHDVHEFAKELGKAPTFGTAMRMSVVKPLTGFVRDVWNGFFDNLDRLLDDLFTKHEDVLDEAIEEADRIKQEALNYIARLTKEERAASEGYKKQHELVREVLAEVLPPEQNELVRSTIRERWKTDERNPARIREPSPTYRPDW